jgi:primosomal protein N'
MLYDSNWVCHWCEHVNFEGDSCESCMREKREKIYPGWQAATAKETEFRKYEEPFREDCKMARKRKRR